MVLQEEPKSGSKIPAGHFPYLLAGARAHTHTRTHTHTTRDTHTHAHTNVSPRPHSHHSAHKQGGNVVVLQEELKSGSKMPAGHFPYFLAGAHTHTHKERDTPARTHQRHRLHHPTQTQGGNVVVLQEELKSGSKMPAGHFPYFIVLIAPCVFTPADVKELAYVSLASV